MIRANAAPIFPVPTIPTVFPAMLNPTNPLRLNGDDLRRDPFVVRKATLTSVLARAAPGLRFNEHLDEEDGPLVFAHACKLGLEGIVSKRRDSCYSSGRSPHWIKSKNPQAPAVKREAEEDWGGWSAKSRHSRQ
jgi:hypothetical protein